MIKELTGDKGSAIMSACGTYRYRLSRELYLMGSNGATLSFIMLNPSTADHDRNDPTIKRCIGYGERFDYKRIDIYNLFALRATDPRMLYAHPEPIGPENDAYLDAVCGVVVCAWGRHGNFRRRGAQVMERLKKNGNCTLTALKLLDDGTPGHPLYLKANLKMINLFNPYERNLL